MKKKSIIYWFLLLISTFGCSLFDFDNEQVPECVELSRSDPTGTIYCFQPTYFGRPDWHPNGKWIAAEHFDSLDTDKDGVKDSLFSGIWLVHSETGNTQPLLPFGSAPDWNPEGSHLAVEHRGRIYTVQITSLETAEYDTSSINLLTNFEAASFYPTWSSDGELIAFDTNYDTEDGGYIVQKIRYDGTGLEFQAKGRFSNWSPIGEKLAYIGLYSELYILDEHEETVIKLTDVNNGDFNTSISNQFPKFSNDGSKIIYSRIEGIKSHLWVIDSDGDSDRLLAKDWAIGGHGVLMVQK